MPVFGTTPVLCGAYSWDRSYWRAFEADDQLLIYLTGWLDPGDGNTATVDICYEKDDASLVVIGTLNKTGGGDGKVAMGPFDLWATPGVPRTEVVPILRLRAVKNAGANGTLRAWTMRVRRLRATR